MAHNDGGGGDFDRVPPHDIAAEQCTVGAMMLSKDAISEVIEIIGPDAHYRPAHTLIHAAILDLFGRGEPADAITVANLLTERDEIARIGGAPYLHTCLSAVPTAANGGYYAQIVRRKHILRDLIDAGTRIGQLGWAADADDPEGLVSRGQQIMYGLLADADRAAAERLAELMPDALDYLEALTRRDGRLLGVPTGLVDLDNLLQGFQGGQFAIVAARPAVGKSTLALDFARNAAKNGIPTCVFSLEMGRREIVMKILAAEARVNLHVMRSGLLTDDDWAKLARRMSEISDWPLWLDDSPHLNLMEIRAKCRQLKARHELGFVIVDYLQLMSAPPAAGRRENRQQEVSEMSRGLKLLAKELEVPVIALSQLNRGPEQRSDKKPLLSDLRESGSLEQDSDVVILVHREDATEKESPRAGEADLIVAKHRNGPTATVTVAFQGHYSRFVDMAKPV